MGKNQKSCSRTDWQVSLQTAIFEGMIYGPHLNANLPCLAPFCFCRVLGHLALAYVNSETYPIKHGTDLKRVFRDMDVTSISLRLRYAEYVLCMWGTDITRVFYSELN